MIDVAIVGAGPAGCVKNYFEDGQIPLIDSYSELMKPYL